MTHIPPARVTAAGMASVPASRSIGVRGRENNPWGTKERRIVENLAEARALEKAHPRESPIPEVSSHSGLIVIGIRV